MSLFRQRLPIDPFASIDNATKWPVPHRSPLAQPKVILIIGEPTVDGLWPLLTAKHLATSIVLIASHAPPSVPANHAPTIRILRLLDPLAADLSAMRLMSIFERAQAIASTPSNNQRYLHFSESFSGGDFLISAGSAPVSNDLTRLFASSQLSLPTTPRPKKKPRNHFDALSRVTFDAIVNFLPANHPEKVLLKHAILVTTLSAQYLAPSQQGDQTTPLQSTPHLLPPPPAMTKRSRFSFLTSPSAVTLNSPNAVAPQKKKRFSFFRSSKQVPYDLSTLATGAAALWSNTHDITQSSASSSSHQTYLIHVLPDGWISDETSASLRSNTSSPSSDYMYRNPRDRKRTSSATGTSNSSHGHNYGGGKPKLVQSIEQFLLSFAYPLGSVSSDTYIPGLPIPPLMGEKFKAQEKGVRPSSAQVFSYSGEKKDKEKEALGKRGLAFPHSHSSPLPGDYGKASKKPTPYLLGPGVWNGYVPGTNSRILGAGGPMYGTDSGREKARQMTLGEIIILGGMDDDGHSKNGRAWVGDIGDVVVVMNEDTPSIAEEEPMSQGANTEERKATEREKAMSRLAPESVIPIATTKPAVGKTPTPRSMHPSTALPTPPESSGSEEDEHDRPREETMMKKKMAPLPPSPPSSYDKARPRYVSSPASPPASMTVKMVTGRLENLTTRQGSYPSDSYFPSVPPFTTPVPAPARPKSTRASSSEQGHAQTESNNAFSSSRVRTPSVPPPSVAPVSRGSKPPHGHSSSVVLPPPPAARSMVAPSSTRQTHKKSQSDLGHGHSASGSGSSYVPGYGYGYDSRAKAIDRMDREYERPQERGYDRDADRTRQPPQELKHKRESLTARFKRTVSGSSTKNVSPPGGGTSAASQYHYTKASERVDSAREREREKERNTESISRSRTYTSTQPQPQAPPQALNQSATRQPSSSGGGGSGYGSGYNQKGSRSEHGHDSGYYRDRDAYGRDSYDRERGRDREYDDRPPERQWDYNREERFGQTSPSSRYPYYRQPQITHTSPTTVASSPRSRGEDDGYGEGWDPRDVNPGPPISPTRAAVLAGRVGPSVGGFTGGGYPGSAALGEGYRQSRDKEWEQERERGMFKRLVKSSGANQSVKVVV